MIKAIPLKDVKIGMCLAEPVFTQTGVIVYNANFYFTSRAQIIKLQDMGIKEVRVNLALSLVDDRSQQEQEKTKYLVKKELEDPVKRFESMAETIDETKHFFDQGEKVVEDVMQSARFGKALNQKAIRDETTKILQNIQKDHLVALALLDLKNFDEYTYIHSINVTVLSVAFAYHLKFSEDKLISIGQGGILHDVGKAKIPLNILNKPDKLNETEYRIIQKHPTLGQQIIDKDNIKNEIVKEIILHHHENYDGSGYPDKLSGTSMKRFASIVSVSDFYDALTSERVYKDVIPPPEAMKIIYSLSGTKFDPRVVNHFIKTVGIYPVGSVVELSDGRIAVVIAFSKDNLLQPVVKTLFNKNNPKIIDEEIISLVHSDIYITGTSNDFSVKTIDIFRKKNES